MSRRIKRSRIRIGRLIGLGIAVLLVTGAIAPWVRRLATTRTFAAELGAYLSPEGLDVVKAEPTIVGKVVALDLAKNRIDKVHAELPKGLRAQSPQEVGTVVWIDCKKRVAGTYTDGAKGYQISCEVTVVHEDEGTRFPSQVIRGPKPPESKSGFGSTTGSRPTKQIAVYLRSLRVE